MALQDNLQAKIQKAKAAGYNDDQINTFLKSQGVTPPAAQPSILETAKNVAIGFAKGAGASAKGLMDTAASVIPQAISPTVPLPPPVSRAITDKVRPVVDNVQKKLGLTDDNLAATNTPQKVGKVSEFAAELLTPAAFSKAAHLPSLIRGVTGRAPLIADVSATASIEDVAKMADEAKRKLLETISKTAASPEERKLAEQTIKSPKATPEQVKSAKATLAKAPATPAEIKAASDAAATPTTLIEKLTGLAPDIKARLKGKGKPFADYLNIVDARNQSDLVPTALEYATSFVSHAKDKMASLLSGTGNAIGQFRAKIGTYQAPRQAFDTIRQSFQNELGQLNLSIDNGKVVVTPGKIAQTVSEGEIGSLQSLYDDLNTASQSPSLGNLIDLRNKFDNKINFAKASREASSSLDPLSRTVRAHIAQVAEHLIGPSEAKHLKEFSEFIDALNDLRSYTDRKAGAEFLLKRVFSERGGDPRAVMETIRKHTGIDLMDHAMMAKIATELSGNAQTMGLFRQEITKAGLDAVNLLKGNPMGAVQTLLDMGAKKLINKRKVFEKAAQ